MRSPVASTGIRASTDSLAARIDAWLPQTQCTRCGYPRCRDYAQAVSRGEADINRCPPGGETTLQALATLTGRTATTLDPACGEPAERTVARIDEGRCIGCKLCIQACPVDAIVGAAKLMHTVIAAECTGCELCLSPCPVDCIDLEPAAAPLGTGPWPAYDADEVARWRRRSEARIARHDREHRNPHAQVTAAPASDATPAATTAAIGDDRQRIRDALQAAIERARLRRRQRQPLHRTGGRSD